MRRSRHYRPKKDEPILCPECPRIGYIDLVRSKSYTREPPLESATKLCAKLRRLDLGESLQCPHYPKSETLLNFVFGKRKKKK